VKKLGIGVAVLIAVAIGAFFFRGNDDRGGSPSKGFAPDAEHPESSPKQSAQDTTFVTDQKAPARDLGRRKGAYVADFDPAIPTGRAIDVYAVLKQRADAGDHRSAVLLYEKLEACRRVLSAQSMEPTTRPEDCTELVDEQYQSAARLIEKAAAAGLVEAQLIYSSDPERFIGPLSEALRNSDRIVEYKKNVLRYLTSSASQGSVDAMSQLASFYRRGGLWEKDPVKAYAYRYASERAWPSATPLLQRYAEGLSSEQLRQGRMQGESMYQACCRE